MCQGRCRAPLAVETKSILVCLFDQGLTDFFNWSQIFHQSDTELIPRNVKRPADLVFQQVNKWQHNDDNILFTSLFT